MKDFKEVCNSLAFPLFVIDDKAKILFANRAACRKWSRSFDDGQKPAFFMDLFEESCALVVKDVLHHVSSTGQPETISCEMTAGSEICKVVISLGLMDSPVSFTATILDPSLAGEEREQLYYRLGFEIMISRLSQEFISSSNQGIETRIQRVLRLLGPYLGAERILLYLLSKSGSRWIKSAGWGAKLAQAGHMDRTRYSWWFDQIKGMETVKINNIRDLGQDAEAEKRLFTRQGVKSLLAVPLVLNNEVRGFMRFDFLAFNRCPNTDQVYLVKMVSEAVANFTERLRMETMIERNRKLYHSFLENTMDMVFLKDKNFKYLMVNQPMADFYRKQQSEIEGKTDFQLMSPREARQCRKSDIRALESSKVVATIENIGDKIYETRKFKIADPQGQVQIGGYIRDVTEENNMMVKLRESEEKYRLIVDNQTELIDKVAPDGTLLYASPSYCRFYRKKKEELIGSNFVQHLDSKQRDKIKKLFLKAIRPPYVSSSLEQVEIGGQQKWVSWINKGVLDNQGRLLYVIGSGRDITEQVKTEKQREFLSLHDSFTSLYTRNFFLAELKREDELKNYPLTVILGDINGLKLVNSSFGQKEGDRIILGVSNAIKATLRKDEIIARWGGDSFAILLSGTGEAQAEKIIARIDRRIARQDFVVPVTISFGVSTKTGDTERVNLIRDAEDKLMGKKLFNKSSSHSAIITSLERALKERDYETEEHVKRMKVYSQKLGQSLGLSEDKLNHLLLLATLHDIGKISIPDNIVLKPGRLTSQEWKIMKTHAEIGFRIAETSPNLNHIAQAILHHHEKWDGSGYPDGFSGKKIPLLSRIIAVVDAYDAMTHDRPYKGSMSKKEAIEELKRCSGSQFDPKIVREFIKILK